MKNILNKIWKGYEYFPYLQKDKKNTFHQYTYLSEAKIKQVAQTMLKELGLVFHFFIEDVRTEFITLGEDKKEKRGVYVTVKAHYEFIDIETGEKIEGTAFGSGWDSNDKALYKAITGAVKYIFNTNFLIPTGDDPENEITGEQYEPQMSTKTEPVKKVEDKKTVQSLPKPKEEKSSFISPHKPELYQTSKEYLKRIEGSDIEVYARTLAGSVNLKELKTHWMNLPAEIKSRLTTLKDILKSELDARTIK